MFLVALKVGTTSFGGPVAHLGYFRREYVERRRWVDEETYADIVALCQFLPGPASSEVGIAVGLLRAGPFGAAAAWLGFTLPSAVLMFAFAYSVGRLPFEAGWLFPLLKIVAFVVVARAVWRMARALAWDRARGTIAVVSAAVVLFMPSAGAQVAVIAAAGVIGRLLLPAPTLATRAQIAVPIGRRAAAACFALFLALLIAFPIGRALTENGAIAPNGGFLLFDSFYRAGALVFGGGHVVLPLLHQEVIPRGWVNEDHFIAGYGAAQALPGPLFTFAAYLGASIGPPVGGLDIGVWPPGGVGGALIATIAIFLPAFLLVFAALPSWAALRARPWAHRALRGVNAAVVGLLLAALVDIARAIASAPI
ncbi:MAG TPA: chromate efflux transporter [Candidatus Limnocylindria bacterium]